MSPRPPASPGPVGFDPLGVEQAKRLARAALEELGRLVANDPFADDAIAVIRRARELLGQTIIARANEVLGSTVLHSKFEGAFAACPIDWHPYGDLITLPRAARTYTNDELLAFLTAAWRTYSTRSTEQSLNADPLPRLGHWDLVDLRQIGGELTRRIESDPELADEIIDGLSRWPVILGAGLPDELRVRLARAALSGSNSRSVHGPQVDIVAELLRELALDPQLAAAVLDDAALVDRLLFTRIESELEPLVSALFLAAFSADPRGSADSDPFSADLVDLERSFRLLELVAGQVALRPDDDIERPVLDALAAGLVFHLPYFDTDVLAPRRADDDSAENFGRPVIGIDHVGVDIEIDLDGLTAAYGQMMSNIDRQRMAGAVLDIIIRTELGPRLTDLHTASRNASDPVELSLLLSRKVARAEELTRLVFRAAPEEENARREARAGAEAAAAGHVVTYVDIATRLLPHRRLLTVAKWTFGQLMARSVPEPKKVEVGWTLSDRVEVTAIAAVIRFITSDAVATDAAGLDHIAAAHPDLWRALRDTSVRVLDAPGPNPERDRDALADTLARFPEHHAALLEAFIYATAPESVDRF